MALARNSSRSSTAQAVGAIGVEIETVVSGAADFERPGAPGPLAETVAAQANDGTHDTNVKANAATQVRARDHSRGATGQRRANDADMAGILRTAPERSERDAVKRNRARRDEIAVTSEANSSKQ